MEKLGVMSYMKVVVICISFYRDKAHEKKSSETLVTIKTPKNIRGLVD
jgi:hypothetical protein